MKNLSDEGIVKGVFVTGDVMVDALFLALPIARKKSRVLSEIGVSSGEYYLATIHRPANTDVKENLVSIFEAFSELPFPVHPVF